MTDRQKVEGAQKVHIEEARVRFDMAIGKLPPLNEEQVGLCPGCMLHACDSGPTSSSSKPHDRNRLVLPLIRQRLHGSASGCNLLRW